MKRLFLILLLLNLLFVGIVQFASNGSGETSRDHQPLNAEKIQIVAEVETPALTVIDLPATTISEKTSVCLEWGTFAGNSLEQALSALKSMNLGESKLAQLKVAETNGYWTYIPPLKSKPEAEKKISELKALAVNDFELMQAAGQWQYAISLGVFATEAASAKYLTQLQKKGVRSAKSGPRQHETGEVKFQFQNVSDELATRLVAIKERFHGSELKAVACQI